MYGETSTEQKTPLHSDDMIAEDVKNPEEQVGSVKATGPGEEIKTNSNPVDVRAAADTTALLNEGDEAEIRSQTPPIDVVDNLDSFKIAARTLLAIHRDEMAHRDEQISKLRGELLRVREGLQAMEQQRSSGQRPLQDVEDHGDHGWTLVQAVHATELEKESQEQL